MSCEHCDCDTQEAPMEDRPGDTIMDAITTLTDAGLHGTITLKTNPIPDLDGEPAFLLDQINLHQPYGVDAEGLPSW